MFLELSQNSQENTCARVSSSNKKGTWHKCFSVNFAQFLLVFLIEHIWWLLLSLADTLRLQFHIFWKWGGTHNREFLHISKSIWNYLLSKQIALSPEYLHIALNVHADWESRNHKGNSEWKLTAFVFLDTHVTTNSGSVDIQALLTIIYCTETRPKQSNNRCVPASLIQGKLKKILILNYLKRNSC